MIAFMEKNYTLPHKLFGGKADYSRFTHNCGDKDWAHQNGLSYDHNPLSIGFDYNACEPERDYIFDVTSWMALKIGAMRPYRGERVPFFYYDGGHCADDRWPLLIKRVWEKKIKGEKWRFVDEVGHKPKITQFYGVPAFDDLKTVKEQKAFLEDRLQLYRDLGFAGYQEIDKILRTELKRLDKLWGKFNG